jgi:hypothetical protein
MKKQLNLYSTSHCHLCELAYSIVMQAPDNIDIKLIDIADDKMLLAQYEIRIPVLQRQDTKAELNWPFNDIDIKEFLK